MKTSFDHITDYSFRELHKFLKKAETVPDYVKDLAEQRTFNNLPKEAFADQGNRAFPKNTKADTYLSYVHLLNKKAELQHKYNSSYVDKIENKLKKSAQLFGIEEDLKSYETSFLLKEANDYEEKSVFEKELENGEVIALFNFKTAEELKYAAEQFSRDYRRIPFEWRFDISKNFVKHAEEEGLEELPDIICKYAGFFYVDPEHVKTELTRRGMRNPNTEFKDYYTKLAEQVDECDSLDDYLKIASTCYHMERMQGIYDNYKTASLFGDPIDQIFNTSVEKLATLFNTVKLGNEYFSIDDLQQVKPEIYKQAFGIDVDLSDKSELRDVLPTMPLSDISLFRELSGISPL